MGKSKQRDRVKHLTIPVPVPNVVGTSTNDTHPAFCFRYNTNKDFSPKSLSPEENQAFVQRLHTLGQYNWGQIQLESRTGLGHERIEASQLQQPLKLPKEIDTVLVFRFSKGRIIGFRKDQTFYISAIDTKFSCYKHE